MMLGTGLEEALRMSYLARIMWKSYIFFLGPVTQR